MRKIQLTHQEFFISYMNEANIMYENGDQFRFELDETLDRVETLTVKIMNVLLDNSHFIKTNALITKQFRLADYFNELYTFLTHRTKVSFTSSEYLILESETIDKIYLRAYFTLKEIKRLNNFKNYLDKNEFNPFLGPDYNYDVRVVKRASMNLLYMKLESQEKNFNEIDLNTVSLWDYRFGLR
jgi:hypothetical protein